jgi:hypothetical protein
LNLQWSDIVGDLLPKLGTDYLKPLSEVPLVFVCPSGVLESIVYQGAETDATTRL